MLLGTLLTGEIAKSALVAYVHYLGIILCFGSLLFERLTLKVGLNRNETISMIIADVVYGLAGVAILVTGILRVKYYGQGGDFYTGNPVFWIKVSLYILVGLLSLYPTTTYILWAIPLSKNKLPEISENLVKRLRLIISTVFVGVSFILLFATLMARGVGLG